MVKLELFCDAVDLHLIIFTNACRPPSVLMQFKPLVIRGNPSMELKNPFVLFSCISATVSLKVFTPAAAVKDATQAEHRHQAPF